MNKTTIMLIIAITILGLNLFFGLFQNCNNKYKFKAVNELIENNNKRLQLTLNEIERELKKDNVYIISNQSNIKECIKWIGQQELKLQEIVKDLRNYINITNSFQSNLEYFKP